MNDDAIWRTKSGAEIPTADLTNHHLVHIIKFLRRHRQQIEWEIAKQFSRSIDTLSGEMAQENAEVGFDEWSELSLHQDDHAFLRANYPKYRGLMKEFRRRGLSAREWGLVVPV